MSSPALPDLWSEEEVAQALRIAVGTLRRWRRCGLGPRFLKLGTLVRYEPSAITAFLESCRRSSTSEEVPAIH